VTGRKITAADVAPMIRADVLGLASLAVRQAVDDHDGDDVFWQLERSAVVRLLYILWRDLTDELRDEIRDQIGHGSEMDDALAEGETALYMSQQLATSMDDVLGGLLGHENFQVGTDPPEDAS
jgi:hypothetical protein